MPLGVGLAGGDDQAQVLRAGADRGGSRDLEAEADFATGGGADGGRRRGVGNRTAGRRARVVGGDAELERDTRGGRAGEGDVDALRARVVVLDVQQVVVGVGGVALDALV